MDPLDQNSTNIPTNLADDEIALAAKQAGEMTALKLTHRRAEGQLRTEHAVQYAELKAEKAKAARAAK
jgi:hypothetical protein